MPLTLVVDDATVVRADAPAAAPDDSAAYAAWLESDFKPWLQSRMQGVADADATQSRPAPAAPLAPQP